MSLSADAVTQLTDWVTTNAGYVAQTKSAYQEIQIADLIHQNWDAVTGALGDFSGKLLDIDYSFIGLNMGQQPSFKIWTFDWSNKAVWLPALGLDDAAARCQSAAGRYDQQDHDDHDAARVAVDLLHDAGRSGHLLDC